MSTLSTVRLTDARKIYPGGVLALRGLDLQVAAGETLALLGPNGAGKTTATKLMLGLIAPSSGSVQIFGKSPRDRHVRTRIGAMLQVANIPATLTVREHLELFSSYYPHPLPVHETLALADLGGLEGRRFGRLSGGQKQRLFFALAICGDPDLLILDEPSVGLDVESRALMWDRIRTFKARGCSIVLTTHYLAEADALADRVALITSGMLVADGTPAEIKARAGTPELEAAYLALTRNAVLEIAS
jgi:ABC-2 type transport system ATP-binding protein